MRVIGLGFLLSFAAVPLLAATATWTGATNGQWSVGSNWLSGVAPSPGDDLLFPGTGVTTQITNNDFPANTLFHSITIDGSNGSGPRLAGNAIQLGAGGIAFTNPAAGFLDLVLDVTLPITLAASQTWKLDDSNGNSSAGLPIDGPVNLNGMALTLQFSGNQARPFWGGPISGAGSITLNATSDIDGIIYNAISTTTAPMTITGGFQELSGAYPGPITVNGAGGTELILNDGTTVGAVHIQQGFFLPSPNPGGTANSGSATLDSASTLAIARNGATVGNFTQLNVTGSVNIASGQLLLGGEAAIPDGSSLTIINNDGSDAVAGTFAGMPEGSLFLSNPPNAQVFRITYAGGDGNDVVVTNVGPLTTTTTLTPSENPHQLGTPLNLTATVTSPSGIPQGTVRFFDGASFLASENLDSSGHATATNVFLLRGTHTLTAEYLGYFAPLGSVGVSTSAAVTEVVLPGPARLPMLDWRVLILLALALAAIGATVSGRG